MARLELDVVQTSSGSGVKDAATAMETLYQAERKLKQAQDDEAGALRKVEIAQARLTEVKKTAQAGSSQLMAAEDKLATAIGRANTAAGHTGAAMGSLSKAQNAAEDASTKHATALGKVDTASGKASGGMGLMAKAGGALAGAMGIAGLVDKAASAVVDFGVGTITAASSLQQASGAAQAVFGKDYPAIEAAANKAATAVGLSSSEYQQMASVMGSQLKSKGIEDFAGQTSKLIGLGADLSAQFGGSAAEAVDALGAMMRGESDPIEKYGVSINAASTAAEAMRLGLAGTKVDQEKVGIAQTRATVAQLAYNQAVKDHGKDSVEAMKASASLASAQNSVETAVAGTSVALTDSQKAQAMLSLVTKQTASSTGAFARESNTLEGSQQRVAAQVQDLQAKIGTALLPALSGVTDYMSRTMSGGTALSGVLQIIGSNISGFLTPIIVQVQQGFANFRASLDKVTGGSAQTEDMLRKVGVVVGQVAGFVGSFVGGQLSMFLTGLGKTVEVVSAVVNWVGRMNDNIGKITLPFGLGQIRDVFGAISDKVEAAVGWVGKLLGNGNANAISAMAGLFRTDGFDGFGGASTGSMRIPLLVPAPVTNVNVNVDGGALRGIIRAEIRASISRGGDTR
jgi:hypothetical protein